MYDHIDLNILFRSIRIKLKKKRGKLHPIFDSLIVFLFCLHVFRNYTLYIS
jgi:hypothetical protein